MNGMENNMSQENKIEQNEEKRIKQITEWNLRKKVTIVNEERIERGDI